MTRRTGNMWDAWEEAALFLITTNSYIKQNGALVMGRGIARQARDRFEGLDKKLGQAISAYCGHLGRYGLMLSPRAPAAKLGIFQVKRHFKDKADLELIKQSSDELGIVCAQYPDAQIHLNYPGIGNGGLSPHHVQPYVDLLPDNVHVWTFEPLPFENNA